MKTHLFTFSTIWSITVNVSNVSLSKAFWGSDGFFFFFSKAPVIYLKEHNFWNLRFLFKIAVIGETHLSTGLILAIVVTAHKGHFFFHP